MKDINLGQNCKNLISLFLKKEVKINWPREIKIAKQLLSKYPEFKFWWSLEHHYNRYSSLCFFINEIADIELAEKYKEFKLNEFISNSQAKTYTILDKPVIRIEHRSIKKPKNLFEFIDGN